MITTWRDLLNHLKSLESDTRLFEDGDSRLDDSITICDQEGEYFPGVLWESQGTDVLDDGHLFIGLHEWGECKNHSDCVKDGTHLSDCDADGFCNICGHQD